MAISYILLFCYFSIPKLYIAIFFIIILMLSSKAELYLPTCFLISLTVYSIHKVYLIVNIYSLFLYSLFIERGNFHSLFSKLMLAFT